MAEGDRVAIRTLRHQNGYILIPVTLGQNKTYTFDLMLNTGRPISYLSPAIYALLEALGHIEGGANSTYVVKDLLMGGRSVPDLIARVSRGPSLLAVDGMLGLHFLAQFRFIESERDSGVLTFTY